MMQFVTRYPLVAMPAAFVGEDGAGGQRGICNQGLRDRKGCDERSGAQKQIPQPASGQHPR
jgi:hypothetical protein